jgi:hypothetical protein
MSDSTSVENSSTPNVSEAWNTKFGILKKIGADQQFIYRAMSSSEYKQLSFKERNKISFNVLAFLFGPIYYFSKKMWYKGSIIAGAMWMLAVLLTSVEIVFGVALPAIVYWVTSVIGLSICAQLADYDYYRKMIHGEKMWGGFPKVFSSPIGAIGFLVVTLASLMFISTLEQTYIIKNQMLTDISGVWQANTDKAVITISLGEKTKSLDINGTHIPVTVQSVDQDSHIVTLSVLLKNGQHVSWSLRQIFDKADSFSLQLTLNDGTQDGLSYVRGL